MKKQEVIKVTFMVLVSLFLFTNTVSAGLGILKSQQTVLVTEGEEKCIEYGVYNPFSGDSSVKIFVSDELKDILKSQDSESIVIPENTASDSAIPINFCFKVPKNIFEKECLVGNMLCKQTCPIEKEEYNGEVLVQTVPSDSVSGSATKTTISADLTVRVQCQKSRTNYTLVFVLLALISAGVLAYLFNKKNTKKKPVKKEIKSKK